MKYKTCRRQDEPGHVHALTFSCFKRRPFLSRERSCLWFLDALAAARQKHRFDLWAYVLMPEHVHLVILPREVGYSISNILLDLKRPVARQAVRFVQQYASAFLRMMRDEQPNGKIAHRFWQRGGGYDRNLVNPDLIHATIEYIHANPVRRGLVKSPDDWRWSSAGYYAGREDVVLGPDVGSIPTIGHWRG
ncbi:MAG: transposase [Planctomycetota bacterium]